MGVEKNNIQLYSSVISKFYDELNGASQKIYILYK